MVSTASSAVYLPAQGRSFGLVAGLKRAVNALVASRVRAAETEMRRHDLRIRENALVYGETRRVPLSEADLLPFNT